LWSNLQLIS